MSSSTSSPISTRGLRKPLLLVAIATLAALATIVLGLTLASGLAVHRLFNHDHLLVAIGFHSLLILGVLGHDISQVTSSELSTPNFPGHRSAEHLRKIFL